MVKFLKIYAILLQFFLCGFNSYAMDMEVDESRSPVLRVPSAPDMDNIFEELKSSLRTYLEVNHPRSDLEDAAKQLAKKDFCLREEDREEDSWLNTYAYQYLFWNHYKDNNVLRWLTSKGFYLAELMTSLKEDSEEVSSFELLPDEKTPPDTKSIFKKISITLRNIPKLVACVGHDPSLLTEAI